MYSWSAQILCNLRISKFQEPIKDKVKRKGFRDTAYQHKGNQRKEGVKALNNPYSVLDNPNQEVMIF
jgi:hypothetical protein